VIGSRFREECIGFTDCIIEIIDITVGLEMKAAGVSDIKRMKEISDAGEAGCWLSTASPDDSIWFFCAKLVHKIIGQTSGKHLSTCANNNSFGVIKDLYLLFRWLENFAG